VKTLHAKIGALTLENDFLEGALTKGVTPIAMAPLAMDLTTALAEANAFFAARLPPGSLFDMLRLYSASILAVVVVSSRTR
jgi:hypothetical protein